jgi:hypothetical protein
VPRPSISPTAQRWRDRALAQLGLPVAAGGGRLDLGEDQVDHAVEQVAAVGHVVVQRHRLDAELLGQLAHRQLLDAARVGQRDRGAQHALTAERGALPRSVGGRT